jgi:hypothetical protein
VETHRTDSGSVMRLSIDELMHLAPRLRGYLKTPTPAWPEIVDVADWLRGELGVSKSLWGDACQAMGREQATIAIAIVSGQTGGAFPLDTRRVFPRHGGKGEDRRAQSRADDLGLRQTATSKPRGGFTDRCRHDKPTVPTRQTPCATGAVRTAETDRGCWTLSVAPWRATLPGLP